MKSLPMLLVVLLTTPLASSFLVTASRAGLSVPHMGMRAASLAMQAEPEPAPEEASAPEAAPQGGYQTFYDDEKEDKVLAAKPPSTDTFDQTRRAQWKPDDH